jgi:hypothetical protein
MDGDYGTLEESVDPGGLLAHLKDLVSMCKYSRDYWTNAAMIVD